MLCARQIRCICGGVLILAFLTGLWQAEGQETERPADELAPLRGARGRRGVSGFQSGSAAEAERAAGMSGRVSVDTSHNKRAVYRVAHAPVQSLANALQMHFQGIPGLSLIPEPTGNALLISSPPDLLDELLNVVQKLDRIPKSAAIEVTILDFPDVDEGKEIGAQEFLGPSDKARARINELKRTGFIQRVRRFRLTAVDNQATNLQANGDRLGGGQAAGGMPAGFQGGGRGNAARFPSAGTTIQCTARIAADKGVVVELSIHDIPANRDAQQMPDGVGSQFLGTLSIPSATTMVAGEIATETANGPSRVVILVSADVIEPPPEKPPAGTTR
jgi:hypothetical protein